jgi:4-amino-4-deoxy-L-arabinose transferase-like glycosyltransferase
MTVKRILTQPFLYLLLQAVVVFVFLFALGRGEVHETADSVGYLQFRMNSVAEALGQMRSVGYPLFVKAVKAISPDLWALPYVQIFLFFSAALLFYKSLVLYGLSGWTAFAATSPLFYERLAWHYGSFVMADLPAAALALTAISCLFCVVSRAGSSIAWIGFTLCVFLACQMRPAYVFLVALAPVLAYVLMKIQQSTLREANRTRNVIAATVLATFLPLLAFCGLRFVTVGHFGLVSFAGVEQVGITTQFLTKGMIERFDPDLRPLATAVLEARDLEGLSVPDGMSMFPMPQFMHYYMAHQQLVCDTIREIGLQQEKHEASSRPSSWRGSNDGQAEVDRWAQRLAWATFRARPGIHALYFIKAFFYSVSFSLYAEGLTTALLLFLFGIFLFQIAWGQRRRLHTAEFNRSELTLMQQLAVLVCLAGLFYLSKILLATAVVAPAGRVLIAASMFIPCTLGAAILATLRAGFRVEERESGA